MPNSPYCGCLGFSQFLLVSKEFRETHVMDSILLCQQDTLNVIITILRDQRLKLNPHTCVEASQVASVEKEMCFDIVTQATSSTSERQRSVKMKAC